MSILMYKQRFRQPNLTTTPNANYAHVRYIARRSGVIKNENMDHGLFGCLNYGEAQCLQSWQEAASAVYVRSKEGKNIFRSVVSFARDTASEIGLDSQEAWRLYIAAQMPTIAEKNGIKLENLGYVCAVHDTKEHPHAHIVFWDNAQIVQKSYVKPSIPNEIRKQMIRDTFAERLQDMYSEKDAAKDDVKELLSRLSKDADILREIQRIRKLLPKTGRIAYKLFPPEIKAEVDALADKLLSENDRLREAAARFVASKMAIAFMYSGNEEYLEKQRLSFENEARRIAYMQITAALREYAKAERQKGFSSTPPRYIADILVETLCEAYALLADDYEEDARQVVGTELSKQARKELYIRLKDCGYEQ